MALVSDTRWAPTYSNAFRNNVLVDVLVPSAFRIVSTKSVHPEVATSVPKMPKF